MFRVYIGVCEVGSLEGAVLFGVLGRFGGVGFGFRVGALGFRLLEVYGYVQLQRRGGRQNRA